MDSKIFWLSTNYVKSTIFFTFNTFSLFYSVTAAGAITNVSQ